MDYFKNKVVLVVEDDAGYRELVQQELAQVDAVALSAGEKTAIETFQWHQEIIQCVLIGTELPFGQSGYEVYDVLEDRLQRKGVVFMASESDRSGSAGASAPIRLTRVPAPQPIEILAAADIDGYASRVRGPRPMSAIRREAELAQRLTKAS